MTNTSAPPPDKETLLQFVVENCNLKVPASEAANKTLTELGMDSLELLELAMEIDSTYSLSLEVSELGAETTLSDLVDNLLKSAG